MKKKVLRTIRNVAISFGVILVLLVGAGLAYTWYVGQQQPVIAEEEETVTQTTPAQRTPTKPAPDAVVGVSQQYLTTPVQPGENASLSLKTNANATCSITVTYGDIEEEEKRSTDSGLKDKVADDYGLVMWTWTVEEYRPYGEWPVEVTCANEVNSGYLRAFLEVAAED